ncbi:hypothetical protein V6N13_113332 [Hibiscus sabdariffa]
MDSLPILSGLNTNVLRWDHMLQSKEPKCLPSNQVRPSFRDRMTFSKSNELENYFHSLYASKFCTLHIRIGTQPMLINRPDSKLVVAVPLPTRHVCGRNWRRRRWHCGRKSK